MINRRVLLLFILLAALRAETKVETPYLGIMHITRTGDSPRKVTMHILKIDLTAPGLSFKLTEPSGSRETIRQTTLDYLIQERAQAAINGHFFTPYPSPEMDSFLVGFAVAQGKVYSAFEKPAQSYAIVTDAPAIAIDESNNAAIVHRDPSFEDGLHIVEDIKPWVAISGSAQVITSGAKSVPTYGEGGLLTPGGPAGYSSERSWYDIPNARTLVALSEDNRTLLFLTVDRAAGSLGLTVGEAADILIADYGAHNGLNLDGGGSVTLAMEDPATHEAKIVNMSADNPKGRAVASNLAIFAKPSPQNVAVQVPPAKSGFAVWRQLETSLNGNYSRVLPLAAGVVSGSSETDILTSLGWPQCAKSWGLGQRPIQEAAHPSCVVRLGWVLPE